MLNTVMLVGRLTQEPEVRQTENGKEVSRIALAVNRSFKNPDGVYETDFIDCVLWEGLAKNVSEYCKKGDTVGIRGRIQVSYYEKDDVKRKIVDVIAEKVTFLSSNHTNEKESDEKTITDSSNRENRKKKKDE